MLTELGFPRLLGAILVEVRIDGQSVNLIRPGDISREESRTAIMQG
jgi:hypothetical protein